MSTILVTPTSSSDPAPAGYDYSAKSMPSIVGTPALFNYSLSVSLRQSPAAKLIGEEVKSHKYGRLSSSPDESQFLAWLTKLVGAKKVIEVGVFLGATTLAIAEALPNDGKILALDVSEEFTSVGRAYWERAGVLHKIDLRLAPANDSLKQLVSIPSELGTYDIVFIDADKPNYDSYYEYSLQLLRVGGVVVVDNVFWYGRILDDSAQDADTNAIRLLNKKVYADSRVDISILPLADGITLCRKL